MHIVWPKLLLGDISLYNKAYLYKYKVFESLSCSVYFTYIYRENLSADFTKPYKDFSYSVVEKRYDMIKVTLAHCINHFCFAPIYICFSPVSKT